MVLTVGFFWFQSLEAEAVSLTTEIEKLQGKLNLPSPIRPKRSEQKDVRADHYKKSVSNWHERKTLVDNLKTILGQKGVAYLNFKRSDSLDSTTYENYTIVDVNMSLMFSRGLTEVAELVNYFNDHFHSQLDPDLAKEEVPRLTIVKSLSIAPKLENGVPMKPAKRIAPNGEAGDVLNVSLTLGLVFQGTHTSW